MAEKVVKIENEIEVKQPVNVTVTNPTLFEFPAEQSVFVTNDLLDVLVTNFPPLPYLVVESAPAPGDVLRNSRTTTGTLITVPNGRVFRGSVELSCSISVAGSSVPTISDGTTEILRCEASGLALSTVTNATSLSDVYIAGPATITFTAGASGLSSGSIAGRLL